MNLSTIIASASVIVIASASSALAGTYVESSSSYRNGRIDSRTNFSGTSFVRGERDYGSLSARGELTNRGTKFKGSVSGELGNESYGSRSRFNGYETFKGYETTNTYTTSAGIR